MKKDKALLVAGVIFAIVAIAHLLRYWFKIEIIFGGYVISMELSLVAFVVAGLLAIWMFMARRSRSEGLLNPLMQKSIDERKNV